MEIDDYESDFNLEQLLSNSSKPKIENALIKMGILNFQIINSDGNIFVHNGATTTECKLPLIIELEPIGFLVVNQDDEVFAGSAALFIAEILQTNWRYQMASSLHLKVSKDDYDTLKEKNARLAESEIRYKEISVNLECRVEEQIKVIEDSQRQLYEAEKLASVGQLAAGVAHEINNPIGFISSNLNTALEYLSELKTLFEPIVKIESIKKEINVSEMEFLFSDFNELLEESSHGAKRVSAIVADLKSFSNVEKAENQCVDLNKNIELVTRIFKTSKPINILLDPEPIPKTICKPAHINQLLLNLLQNAAEALTFNGEIVDDSQITISTKAIAESIKIEIKDNGRGIPKELVNKIFNPFYTTREIGSGTGLGLTVCMDIAKAHHGNIHVKSKQGQGTSVFIELPLCNDESQL